MRRVGGSHPVRRLGRRSRLRRERKRLVEARICRSRQVCGAAVAAGAATGFGAAIAGLAAADCGTVPSVWSPFTATVRIGRGELLGNVPLLWTGPVLGDGTADGETLATDGGFAFWFSGGNTTRGPPALALTSTGASSRGTIFSVPSPLAMRSGTLAEESVGAGTILVGVLSALMIGGSPLRGEPI